MYWSANSAYRGVDVDKYLAPQSPSISTNCKIEKSVNIFTVVGNWSGNTFLYGTVIKNGYNKSIGYPGATNGWNSLDVGFSKNNKKYIHVKDYNNKFKFPVGTIVKIYGR